MAAENVFCDAPQVVSAQPPLITIIVCTYRRAAPLRRCIESLIAAEVPEGLSWELLCVDNDPNDEVHAIVESLAKKAAFPIRYLIERQRGKGRALNTGLANARGDLIAITDDDCIVAHDWIAVIRREFERDPTLDMLGGRVELYDPASVAISIRTARERTAYSDSTLFNLLPGANLIFRRSLLGKIGSFDPEFGPGGPTEGAEDSDFIYRAARAGCRVEYSPDVVIYHNHQLQTEDDRRRKEDQYLTSRGVFYAKYLLRADDRIAKIAYWESITLCKSALRWTFLRQGSGKGDFRRLVRVWGSCARQLLWQPIRSALKTRRSG